MMTIISEQGQDAMSKFKVRLNAALTLGWQIFMPVREYKINDTYCVACIVTPQRKDE